MRKLAAGNWKMNGLSATLTEVDRLLQAHPAPRAEMLLCPPATLISRLADRANGTALQIGGQDCHEKGVGAHTGDISAEMLLDAGAKYVILGHSERRSDYAETNEQVHAKACAAISAGLTAIVCLGETGAQRDQGQTLEVIGAQLAASVPNQSRAQTLVIAYEPVWAIGTGRTPTLDEIAEVHAYLRARLAEKIGQEAAGVRLLYGGSVKPSNAGEIFSLPDVDGALVGGASLTAEDFGAIVEALERAS